MLRCFPLHAFAAVLRGDGMWVEIHVGQPVLQRESARTHDRHMQDILVHLSRGAAKDARARGASWRVVARRGALVGGLADQRSSHSASIPHGMSVSDGTGMPET